MDAKKMYILRGNQAAAGKYPDERGQKIAWPRGALHEKAATIFAQCLGYTPVVLDAPGYPQGKDSPQTELALKTFFDDDPATAAFYGFSGGGYNLKHILDVLAASKPQSLHRIDRLIVLGAPYKNDKNQEIGEKLFQADRYDEIGRKNSRDQGWKPLAWEVVFRENPDRAQMPPNLPKDLETHMFGPDVLLSGWPGGCHNSP